VHALLQSVIDIAARGEGRNRNVRVFVQRRFASLTIRSWCSLRIELVIFQTRMHLLHLVLQYWRSWQRGSVCLKSRLIFKRGPMFVYLYPLSTSC
jgi:hypothetical protein